MSKHLLRRLALFLAAFTSAYAASGVQTLPFDPNGPQTVSINYGIMKQRYLMLSRDGPYARKGYYFYEISANLTNFCARPLRVDAQMFRLIVTHDPGDSQRPSPRGTSIAPYEGGGSSRARFKSELLLPGQSTGGGFVFEVPDRLQDGKSSNGAYMLLRATGGLETSCELRYAPN